MTTSVTKVPSKEFTVRTILQTYKAEIQSALPKHVSPDRMLRIAMTCARMNTELLECTPESFLGAVIQSAQLGLEPGTPLGQAYLIPFQNNRTGKKEVQFLPGYRGLMDLVYRASDAPVLMPTAVYPEDQFEYEMGLNPRLIHKPGKREYGSKLSHAYCTASFKDGRKEFIVMSHAEIEAIKTRSKSAKSKYSPWMTDYEAMALKTVIRRLVKYLPMSAELQTAIGLDDLADSGQSQHNDTFLKINEPIQTKAERVTEKMSDDPDNFDNFDGK